MRLIDADALKERIGKICDKAKEEYEHTSLTRLTWIFQGLKNALFTEIDNEPTAQTWVTCEERLPEMKKTAVENSFSTKYDSDPVIVQTKRGEIFLAICRKTEYTDSMWKDTIDWHTFGTQGRKMKVMSKVVAWMPQPEPWKPNF
jgi:hypothetical protein